MAEIGRRGKANRLVTVEARLDAVPTMRTSSMTWKHVTTNAYYYRGSSSIESLILLRKVAVHFFSLILFMMLARVGNK